MSNGYTQFRLSNGDEIVAQVVQEPEEDDVNLVVRNALMIVRAENVVEGYRYYSFRPWMSYQLNDDYYQLLNYSHIVGEAKPDTVLLEQYKKAIQLERDTHEPLSDSDRQVQQDMSISTADYLRNLMNELDSDEPNNIIRFDRGKLH